MKFLPVAIVCAASALGLSGCSYAVLINLSRPHAQADPLTATEVREAAEIVEQTAREFELPGGTREPALRECSEDGNCDGSMIAHYHGSVTLSIVLYKSTGQMVITIRDFHAFTEVEPIPRLEEAIKTAVSKCLPSFQIEVRWHVEFPNLGP
jgi:hypothetical protein